MKRRSLRKILGFGLITLMSLGFVFLTNTTPATTMMVSPGDALAEIAIAEQYRADGLGQANDLGDVSDGLSDGLSSGLSDSVSDGVSKDADPLNSPPNLFAQAVGARSGGIWRAASFPVENFQTYTSPFGYRRSATGGPSREFHYGLDLAAPNGSYIRSWWMGKVVEVSDNSRCGTSVVVQSGTWEHIYCHMQGKVEVIKGQRYMVDREGGLQIREGQIVQTGSRIGRVGMTGRTTGPHLHWGMKNKGQWVDPGQVLRAMQASQLS